MKFSNKVKFYIFALLIILNLLLRWFVSNHEQMVDSYEMHILANSISEFGEARWWTNPLSIIGMYPNSYASMIAFFISGISQISGIDIEKAAFLYSISFGLLSIFGSYILAGVFYNDDFYKFLVSFGFSLSPGVLAYTTWVEHARSPFIIILPLFLFTLFGFHKRSISFKLICIIYAALLTATHHMVFFIIPIIIAYFSVEITRYTNLKKYINLEKLNGLLPFFIASVFIIFYLYAFLNSKFQTAGSRWVNFSFIIIEYPRYIGLLIFLSIGGFFYLLFKYNKSKEEWILLTSLALLTPFINEEMYAKWFILIFAYLLAGIGFLNIMRASIRNKKYIHVIISFLLLSVTFSGYFQYLHDYTSEAKINDNGYLTSIWIKQFSDGNYISNNRWEGWKIAAVSGKHFLTGSSSSDQAYGYVDVKEFNLTTNAITSEEFWLDSPYKRISGTVSDGYWQIIMEHEIDNNWNKPLMERFHLSWLVEYTLNDGYWKSHHGYKLSPYISSVSTNKGCIYDSGDFNIWSLV